MNSFGHRETTMGTVENLNITLESALLPCISAPVNSTNFTLCGTIVYIYWKNTTYKWTHTVQIHVIQCLTVQYLNNGCRQKNFALPLNTMWPFKYNFPKSLFLHLHNYLPYKVSKSLKSKNNVKVLKTVIKIVLKITMNKRDYY